MNLQKLFLRAKDSAFYRTMLNWLLGRMIPFNKPHGFEITEVGDDHIRILLPYKRRNMNHIRGTHACALATVSEFTTGLLLISKLDPKKYRLIMQRLEMDYHYQGKTDAWSTFSLPAEWLNENVYEPLKSSDAIVVPCEVKIHDVKGNLLTTGKIFWQIKDWEKVKTKVTA